MRFSIDVEFEPKNIYCYGGITEVLAPALATIFGGGEAAGGLLGGLGSLFGIGEAVAAPAEAAGAAGLTADGLGFTSLAAGEAVPASLTGTALTIPGVSAAAGAGDVAAGLGAAGLGAGSALALSPNAVMGGEFGPFGAGTGETPVSSPGGGPTPSAAPPGVNPVTLPGIGSPAPGGGTGAAALAGPSGLDSLPSIGPGGTAANPLDLSATAAAGTPAAPSTNPLTGIGSFLTKNPGLAAALGIGAAGTLLAPKLAPKLAGTPPGSDALNTLAQQESAFGAQQNATGQTLTQPLVTGQLPPGQEQSVQNAINDAISTTKARYASLGLTGSTMEADAISNIQNQATGVRATIEEQMAQTGLSASSQASGAFGLQGTIYSQLMQAQIAQDTALQSAIAQFASAAAIGTGLASKAA